MEIVLGILISAAITGVLTPVSIRFGHQWGFDDVPNQRSSHSTVKPRGIGIAAVMAVCMVALLLFTLGTLAAPRLEIVLVAAVLIGGVGLIDDRKELGTFPRLSVHLVAAATVIGLEALSMADADMGNVIFAEGLIAGIALVWALNLYNFMDGIDGIALQQAIFLSFGGGLILLGSDSEFLPVLLSLGASASVLLIWNWAPSKAFIGDVGSGFIGFLTAAIAWDTIWHAQADLYTWIILWGSFLVDSTWTLLYRLMSGQKWLSAHRSHAYQRLARKLRSHSKVSLITAAVNWLWLLPWALFASLGLVSGKLCVAIALAPILIGVISVRAGCPDETEGS